MHNHRPTAREMGIVFGLMEPGPLNAITDVQGVRVGQVTVCSGDSGPNAACTGVTVILPHPGNLYQEKTLAAVHTINGYGKPSGFEQVRELGVLETPIALTSTLCVGRAWDALTTWTLERNPDIGRTGPSLNPLVAECNDMRLNDLRARHIREEHVLQALAEAAGGPVAQGAVGAGTGMICYEFKGGIGTASRRVGDYTLGALVLTNFGSRPQLTVAGVPVGKALVGWTAQLAPAPADGSVIVVVATDAPLTCRQLGRIARRTGLGLARTGSSAGNTSGDFGIAFSTAQRIPQTSVGSTLQIRCLPDGVLNPFFQATVESVEEAVINALCKAETTQGRDAQVVDALPLDRLVEIFHRHGYPEVHLP